MTVVQPNSIAGINSISVQSGQSLSIHKSDGTLIREIVASTGISTYSSISVGSATTDNNANKSINIGLGASIAQHADNTLSFGTNGDERLRIDSGGRIGIGIVPAVGEGAELSIKSSDGQTNVGLIPNTNSESSQLTFYNATNDSAQGYIRYDNSSNSLQFRVNLAERLRIDSAGNVGIGEDVPASRLHLANTGSGNVSMTITNDTTGHSSGNGLEIGIGGDEQAQVWNYENTFFRLATNNAERLRITADGRVLIGGHTTASIVAPGGVEALTTAAGNIGGARFVASALGSDLSLAKSRNATVGSHTIVQDDDTIGTIKFRGSDGGEWVDAATISCAVDGTPGDDDMPGRLVFSTTADSASSPTERLRITSAGDIFIGNTNGGSEAINMVGGGGGILISRAASGSPNDGQTLADIGLNSYSSGNSCSSADVLIRGQADGNHSGSSAGSALLLFTKPASTGPGSAPTERLRINKDGNIIPGTNNATSIGDGSTNFNTIWASTRFRGNDNVKVVLGNSQDLVIRHDGTSNIIGSPVGGDLYIKSGTGDVDNQMIASFKHTNGLVGIGTDAPVSLFDVRHLNHGTDEQNAYFNDRTGGNSAWLGSGLILGGKAKTSAGSTHFNYLGFSQRDPNQDGAHGANAYMVFQGGEDFGGGNTAPRLINSMYGSGAFDWYIRAGAPYGVPKDPAVSSSYWMPSLMKLRGNGILQVSGNSGSYDTYSAALDAHQFRHNYNDHDVVWSSSTTTSFTNTVYRADAARSGGTAFNLITLTTGNLSDDQFRVRGDGEAYADGGTMNTGADYAEFFEWSDGNPSNQDRRGYTVVLIGNKVGIATAGDSSNSIIGAVSAFPAVIGDGAWNKWNDKYLRDDFGAYIMEDHTVISWKDEISEIETTIEDHGGGVYNPSDAVIPTSGIVGLTTSTHDSNGTKYQHQKLNPSFDPSKTYIPREDRQEWDAIGLMGKLRIRKGQQTGTNWIKMRDISSDVEEWLVR